MTSSGVTITAQVILNGLCELLTGPSKGMGLTAPRRDAFKLILQCHGGQDFLTTRPEREIEGLLHCLWESAHMELPKQTRVKLKAQAWETYVAFLIMRGSCCAHRTEDERLFYWRQGRPRGLPSKLSHCASETPRIEFRYVAKLSCRGVSDQA